MVEVIELDAEDGSGSPARIDERLGGDYLVDGPLSSYLGDREQVAFAIHAKRGGVTVEGDGDSETYKPARGHRTVVAITDLRLVIAIGGADAGSDRVIPIPFSAVTRIDTDSGLLRERLLLRTEAGQQWSLPAGGDLEAVVAYLEESKAAWSQADRFGARVDEQLVAARNRLDDEPDAALEAAEEALSVIAAGREQVRTFDVGDRVLAHADFDAYHEEVRTVQRRALLTVADEHLERADHYEAAGRLRAAHEAFRDGRDAAEQARSIDADQPPGGDIDERLQSAERDLARLEDRPRETATTALSDAEAIDDPQQRARLLSDALAAHRDWLSLCWGPDAPFEGDPEAIRERILEIVDALVEAHTSVIERLLAAAERLHANARTEQALAACGEANDHLETAREVVTELAPDRESTVARWRIAIDHQRALIVRDEGRDSTGSDHNIERDDHVKTEGTSAEHDRPDHGDSNVAGITARDTDSAESPGSDGDLTDTSRWVSISDDRDSTADRRATLDTEIRAMDESSFTEFVAACWRELGWETTIFAHSSGKYDIMAIRRRAIDLRVLIWTVHTPGRGLDASVVDRCVTDRDDTERADAAALVTTADVPESVRQRAADHDIKLLDRDDLLDLVEDERLTDLLLDVG